MKNWTLWICETFFFLFFFSFFYTSQWLEKSGPFFSLCCAEGCAKHARPGSGWRCCVGVGAGAHSILLECWYLHPCVAVLMYCNVGRTLVYEQDLRPALFKSGDECRGCERSRTSVHYYYSFFLFILIKEKNKKDAPPKRGALHLALIAAVCTGSPSQLIRLLLPQSNLPFATSLWLAEGQKCHEMISQRRASMS